MEITVNHIAIARGQYRARYRTPTGMLSSILPSTFAGKHRCSRRRALPRWHSSALGTTARPQKRRRLSTAVDNMSQGLLTFDAQGRIVLLNCRYIDLYKVSPKVVRPGCSLRDLIQHRKETRVFSGNVDSYCRKVFDGAAKGQSTQAYVQASDGRIVLAKNEPLPDGGWVSTHENVTEQHRAAQERAAINDQEQRRAAIDAAIAAFRPQAEELLSS